MESLCSPHRCVDPYGEAKIQLTPDPRVCRHRELVRRGERKGAIEKILGDFINRGWPERCHVEWASPCFVVAKKVARDSRLVVDYHGVNVQKQHGGFTLSLIEEMLQKEFRRKILRLPLADESRACTAMSTPLGPLQWKMMPRGVTNSTTAFQRMLETLLEPVCDCMDPFVDDMIIASKDDKMSYNERLEAHQKDVTIVLDLVVRLKPTGSGDKAPIAVSGVVFTSHAVGNGQRNPIP